MNREVVGVRRAAEQLVRLTYKSIESHLHGRVDESSGDVNRAEC